MNTKGTENRRHVQGEKSWIEHNWDIIQNCILGSAHTTIPKKKIKKERVLIPKNRSKLDKLKKDFKMISHICYCLKKEEGIKYLSRKMANLDQKIQSINKREDTKIPLLKDMDLRLKETKSTYEG